MRREALSSSAIEGTITTITDLLAFEAGADQTATSGRDQTREVHNYVRALERSLDLLDAVPVSRRLLCKVHQILLQGIKSKQRGAHKRPGEFRTVDPAWTGSANIHDARFVFAPPDQVEDLFATLERYIQTVGSGTGLPPLIDVALIHYQFEVIHPFHDGNGRVGRLLIPLLLRAAGQLEQPLLFISPYFEANRDDYLGCLYDVSSGGAWRRWVEFFLVAVARQAEDAIIRSRRLLDLHAKYRQELQQARASALLVSLVDLIFESPVISIPLAKARLGVSYNAAKNNIDKMVVRGFLIPLDFGERPKLFLAKSVSDAVFAPEPGP